MSAVIAMLRGVNIGSYQKVSMAALRTLCASVGLQEVQSYIQSGNLVFREESGDLPALAKTLEDAIHGTFGFRTGVVLRTTAELGKVVARNPFADRAGVEPNRLLVVFLGGTPSREARERMRGTPCEPEEWHIHEREVYIYYPHGMAHPKIPIARMEKILGCPSTGRNWNTVNKLLAMAEKLETQK